MRKGQLKNEGDMMEVFMEVSKPYKGFKGLTAGKLLEGFFGKEKQRNASTMGAVTHWLNSKVNKGELDKVDFGGREVIYFMGGDNES